MATILVVDYQPVILGVCTHMFEIANYEMSRASGGAGALQLLRQHPRDVALLDVNMPDMDGVTLAENIRLLNPQRKSFS